MKNKNFNKAIGQLKKLRMTRAEKDAMLARVLGHELPSERPAAFRYRPPVKSYWTVYSFSVWIKQNRQWSYAIAAVLAVSLSTGGVAFAAQGSLPGDALYPVKVDVTEPLQTALTFSAEGKAQLAADLAVERMKEAQALAVENKLDTAKQREIQSIFNANTAALSSNLTSVRDSDPKKASDIASHFQAAMLAQAEALDNIANATSSEGEASPTTVPAVVISTSTVSTSTPVEVHVQPSARFRHEESSIHGRSTTTLSVPVFETGQASTTVSHPVNETEPSNINAGRVDIKVEYATATAPQQQSQGQGQSQSQVQENTSQDQTQSNNNNGDQSGFRSNDQGNGFGGQTSYIRALSGSARHAAESVFQDNPSSDNNGGDQGSKSNGRGHTGHGNH